MRKIKDTPIQGHAAKRRAGELRQARELVKRAETRKRKAKLSRPYSMVPAEKSDGVRVTLKVPEAARIAGCGERSIRNGIADGTIPHLRFGRNIVIPYASFVRWIEESAVARTA